MIRDFLSTVFWMIVTIIVGLATIVGFYNLGLWMHELIW